MGQCNWFPLSFDEISVWVDRHRGELPQTLDELECLPVPFRKVIVSRVGPELKVAFWRAHLDAFIRDGSALDAAQRVMVMEAHEKLPIFFSEPGSPGPSMREFDARLRGTFPHDLANKVFGTLGPPEPPGGLPIPPDAFPPDRNATA